jgi:DNA-directed RNA polymerase subunit RPC12/RpoP
MASDRQSGYLAAFECGDCGATLGERLVNDLTIADREGLRGRIICPACGSRVDLEP